MGALVGTLTIEGPPPAKAAIPATITLPAEVVVQLLAEAIAFGSPTPGSINALTDALPVNKRTGTSRIVQEVCWRGNRIKAEHARAAEETAP